MAWRQFKAPADGGVLVGQVQGEGPRVLLLHGGPSLSADYLEALAAELVDGYTVAWYQQRSLAPSVETGPFTVEQHVRDITAVLDALDWPSAWLVGHSWVVIWWWRLQHGYPSACSASCLLIRSAA